MTYSVCHNNFWYNLNQVVNYYTPKAQTAESLPAGFCKIGECVVSWYNVGFSYIFVFTCICMLSGLDNCQLGLSYMKTFCLILTQVSKESFDKQVMTVKL